MPFKMVQNLSSYTSLKPSRIFRTETEMGSTLWGRSGCSSAQSFSPGGEARRPKYCENDSFCGSSGLLGIRKCHKSQERDCAEFPAHISDFRGSDAFSFIPEKQTGFLNLPLSTRLKLYIFVACPSFELPRMLPNPQFAAIFNKLICIVKNYPYFGR